MFVSDIASETARAFLRDESAVTTIEYSVIASLLAAAIIPVIGGVGGRLAATFTKLSSAMQDAPPIAEGQSYGPPQYAYGSL